MQSRVSLNLLRYILIYYWLILILLLNVERIDDIFQRLKSSEQRFKIYRKENLPTRFHYGYLNRLGDLVLIADEGYQIFKVRHLNLSF